jgi:hypothetical protein
MYFHFTITKGFNATLICKIVTRILSASLQFSTIVTLSIDSKTHPVELQFRSLAIWGLKKLEINSDLPLAWREFAVASYASPIAGSPPVRYGCCHLGLRVFQSLNCVEACGVEVLYNFGCFRLAIWTTLWRSHFRIFLLRSIQSRLSQSPTAARKTCSCVPNGVVVLPRPLWK